MPLCITACQEPRDQSTCCTLSIKSVGSQRAKRWFSAWFKLAAAFSSLTETPRCSQRLITCAWKTFCVKGAFEKPQLCSVTSPQTEAQVPLLVFFLCGSQTTLVRQRCHIKHWGSHHSSSGLMDGMIDGLTDDYIGNADKISVILCTREMRHEERERLRDWLRVGFIINITNSFPWRREVVTARLWNSAGRRRETVQLKAHQRMFMFESQHTFV